MPLGSTRHRAPLLAVAVQRRARDGGGSVGCARGHDRRGARAWAFGAPVPCGHGVTVSDTEVNHDINVIVVAYGSVASLREALGTLGSSATRWS